MNKKLVRSLVFGIGLCSIIALSGCGKGVTKSNSSAARGGNGEGGGSMIVAGSISCTMVAAAPSYYSVALTLSVLGIVDRVIVDNQVLPTVPDPVTKTLVINYSIPAPGPRTVTVTISNSAGAVNSCFAGFNSPTLEQARLASIPSDNNGFQYPQDVTLTDSNGDRFRYLISIKKSDGLAYWNSIALDADVEPGIVDAWMGWKKFDFQWGKTDRETNLVRNTLFTNAFNLNIFSDFFNNRYDLPLHCGAGKCGWGFF